MPTRSQDWRHLVVKADPEFNKNQRDIIEYEFTASGRRVGNSSVEEGGKRVFRGDPNRRGPYAD